MHLCFLDESGPAPKPPKPGAKAKRCYFVIAGLIMHEAQWHGVASDVAALLRRPKFNVQGEIKWRYFGPDNDDPDNSVAHLDQETRNELRDKLFEIITARKSLRILAGVASVEAAYKLNYVTCADDLYVFTYKTVTERFQYYLQDISRAVGDKQLGIIVADHRGKSQDDQLRQQHRGLVHERGAFSSKYDNYVETVFLTPSHHSVGIQLVDMVAGAIGRQFNYKDDYYARKLTQSFRASPTGKIEGYGLVKFPKEGWV